MTDNKAALDALDSIVEFGIERSHVIFEDDIETIRAALSNGPEVVTVEELTVFIHSIPGDRSWGEVVEEIMGQYPSGLKIVKGEGND